MYLTTRGSLTSCQGKKCSKFSKTIMTAKVPQLSKCLKFEAVWGVLTDQMI